MVYNPNRGQDSWSNRPEAMEKVVPGSDNEKARQIGITEFDQAMENPKYGFLVREDDKENPDFWRGILAGLEKYKDQLGDVSEVKDRLERMIEAIGKSGIKVDTGQVASALDQIIRSFQQAA